MLPVQSSVGLCRFVLNFKNRLPLLKKTNEVIGRAETTEFDEDFVSLLKQAESTHEASKHIMGAIEQWINPCVCKLHFIDNLMTLYS